MALEPDINTVGLDVYTDIIWSNCHSDKVK